MWFKVTLSNLVQWVRLLFLVVFSGRYLPKPYTNRSHRLHCKITMKSALKAHDLACNAMLAEGWTIGGIYELAENSCFPFAMQLASEWNRFLAEELETGLAFPLALVGYGYKNSDGKIVGHVVVSVVADGETWYFHPYAELEHRKPFKMTPREFSTINMWVDA